MAWFDRFTEVLIGIAGVGGRGSGLEASLAISLLPRIKRPEQADFASLPFHPVLGTGVASTHTALSG